MRKAALRGWGAGGLGAPQETWQPGLVPPQQSQAARGTGMGQAGPWLDREGL